jgi:PAS domain S-box-containing protein
VSAPDLDHEVNELRRRIREAEETLDAIRHGRVDALVIESDEQQSVITLESAELPYRQFLEHMGEGATSLDASGHMVFTNRFLAELLGVEPGRLLGTPLADYLSSASRCELGRALAQLEAGHSLRVQVTLDARTRMPAQLAITATGSGHERRYTVVVTDLSERENLREVRAAHEAVEAENARKDHFLAALGHELRSPIGVVLGWTQLLLGQRELLSPHALRGLEAIERSAKLQRTLIEDVLDVARISAGKLRASLVPLDLSRLVVGVVSAFEPKAQSRGLALHAVTDSAVHVTGDEARVQQLLQNLLENACKFTETGGSIEVTVRRLGERAELSVRDSGVGIDPELLPRVFEPFRQRSVAKSRGGGLGLGLSIAKHISELHGGAIHVESEGLGRGARFVWSLPLSEEGRLRDSAPGERAPLAGMRVLVVDDEDEARELAARSLERSGADVVAVDGSAAAMARLERESFDAVVSDLLMGAGDGYGLARTVQGRLSAPPPMIALSSLAPDHAWEPARRAGFRSFVQKPTTDEQLARAVAALRAGNA